MGWGGLRGPSIMGKAGQFPPGYCGLRPSNWGGFFLKVELNLSELQKQWYRKQQNESVVQSIQGSWSERRRSSMHRQHWILQNTSQSLEGEREFQIMFLNLSPKGFTWLFSKEMDLLWIFCLKCSGVRASYSLYMKFKIRMSASGGSLPVAASGIPGKK